MPAVELETEIVPLSIAAQNLRVSWGVAWRRLLRGELVGRQIGSRWFVTRESLESLVQQQQSTSGNPAVG